MAKEWPARDSRFPTPDDIPDETGCRQFSLPDDSVWPALLMGAVLPLANPQNWYPYGSLTADEAADAWQSIIDAAYASTCGETTTDIETPWWDSGTNVDDSFPPDEQPWYGAVANYTDPADELTFVENVAIWTFTGFLAVSGDIGAAIAFHTIAPRFVLAFKKSDVGEIIRIVIDSADYANVDTSTFDDVVEIFVDAGTGEHDILLVRSS